MKQILSGKFEMFLKAEIPFWEPNGQKNVHSSYAGFTTIGTEVTSKFEDINKQFFPQQQAYRSSSFLQF